MSVLKHCQVRKEHDDDCLKKFVFPPYTSSHDSNFWKKCSFDSKKVNSVKTPLVSDGGSFLVWMLDLNSTCKIGSTQNR